MEEDGLVIDLAHWNVHKRMKTDIRRGFMAAERKLVEEGHRWIRVVNATDICHMAVIGPVLGRLGYKMEARRDEEAQRDEVCYVKSICIV